MKAIISFVLWFVRRWFTKRDDPQAQNQRNRDENSKIIATGNQRELNRKLDDALNRLRNKGGGDSSG